MSHYLVVGAVLFVSGVLCMATKRNALGVLMGIELVLNGANVNFVAFGSKLLRGDVAGAGRPVDRAVRDRAGGGRGGRGAGHRAELLQQPRHDRRRQGGRLEGLMDTSLLPILLGIAVLLPLISFFVILALGRWWKPVTGWLRRDRRHRAAGVLSAWSLAIWLSHHPPSAGSTTTRPDHAAAAACRN